MPISTCEEAVDRRFLFRGLEYLSSEERLREKPLTVGQDQVFNHPQELKVPKSMGPNGAEVHGTDEMHSEETGHYPPYLRSCGSLLKFPLTGKGELKPPCSKKGNQSKTTGQLFSPLCPPIPWSRSSWKHTENRDVTGDSQHGFKKGRLCLMNLAFYDGITVP